MGYYGNKGLGLAWDLRAHFSCVPKFTTRWVKKIFFFNLGLKGVMEKCVDCLLVYPF